MTGLPDDGGPQAPEGGGRQSLDGELVEDCDVSEVLVEDGGGFCATSNRFLTEAARCSLFQLDGNRVFMTHNEPTGVDGTVCMAGGGLWMSGAQVITNTVYFAPEVLEVPEDIEERAAEVVYDADLSAEIADAFAVSAATASLPCDVTFADLLIDTSSVLVARDFNAGGQAVVCVAGGTFFGENIDFVHFDSVVSE